MQNHGGVLSLDIGDARVGVAVTDPQRIMARPHSTLPMNKELPRALGELIANEKISEVVVGLPIELDGTVGVQANKVLAFVEKLRTHLQQKFSEREIPVHTWDERLTTAQAERMIAGTKAKNRDRSALLDQVAAVIILESFLSAKRP